MTGRHGGNYSAANASACSACSVYCTQFGHVPVSLDEANDLIHEHTIMLDDPASAWPHRHFERRRACRGLLNRFYRQIRYGCGNPQCMSPSCLDSQKRLLKGPFRPYTVLSARALATYLASHDYPEQYLCDNMASQLPDSSESNIAHESIDHPRINQKPNGKAGHKGKKSVRFERTTVRLEDTKTTTRDGTGPKTEEIRSPTTSKRVSKMNLDGPAPIIKKDLKSFSQTLFDTIAFKALYFAKAPDLLLRWISYNHAEAQMHENEANRSAVTHQSCPPTTNASVPQVEVAEGRAGVTDTADIKTPLSYLSYGSPNNNEDPVTNNPSTEGAESVSRAEEQVKWQTSPGAAQHGHRRLVPVLSGLIPKHLLIASPPAITRLVCSISIRAPKTLSHFTHKNVEALIASVRNSGQRSVHTDNQFLCSYRRPIDPMRRAPSRDGHASQDEAADFACQSIVYIFGNVKSILMSFRNSSPNPTPPMQPLRAYFTEVECALRQLMQIGSYPSIILSSLWACLGKLERSLCAQSHQKAGPNSRFEGTIELSDADVIQVMDVVLASLAALVPTRSWKHWDAFLRFRRLGRSVPAGGILPENVDLRTKVLEIMDVFEDDMALKLLKRLIKITMLYWARGLEGEAASVSSLGAVNFLHKYFYSPEMVYFIRMSGTAPKLGIQPNFALSLEVIIEWLRTIMIKEWNGKARVAKGSPVWGAAEILAHLYQDSVRIRLDMCKEAFVNWYFVDRLDVVEMPTEWVKSREDKHSVHLLSYPFLFPDSMLVQYFRAINYEAMSKAYEGSLLSGRLLLLMTWTNHETGLGAIRRRDKLNKELNNFFVLEISRENILTDAFNQLWRRHRSEVLKPLKVRIGAQEGEEGVDHGGVQQEFFRLAIAEAFKPDYGMFVTEDQSRMSWFQAGSYEPLYKFNLLGLMTSLAVYNGLTLPFTFPLALYRKLLGLHNTEDDIIDGWPALAKGLKDLLSWKGEDVEDVFMRYFEFSVDIPGARWSVPMDPKGSPYPLDLEKESRTEPYMVTNENRRIYVRDYIWWLTHRSVLPQYEAFEHGFYYCLDRKATSMFTPDMLKLLVEGTSEINVDGLQKATSYDGYTANDQTIKNFWHVVRSFSPEQLRKLLEFVTASDRVPYGGIETIEFMIQQNGPGDDGRLPSASTCFSRLLLPEYSSWEKLKEKLCLAIENSQGFGVV